jgi:hypothetical protein
MVDESKEDYAARTGPFMRKVDPTLVLALTDYEAQSKKAEKANAESFGKKYPFEVRFRRDHKKIAARLATEYVDGIVKTFVYKVNDKLLDLVLVKKTYEARLIDGGYSSGVFTADIDVRFPDGTGFKAHLILKHVINQYGTHFVQYPLTFHNVVVKSGAAVKAMVPEDELYREFGIPLWAPPKNQTNLNGRWRKIDAGNVIRTTDGRVLLVERVGTDPDAKKALLAARKAAKKAYAEYRAARFESNGYLRVHELEQERDRLAASTEVAFCTTGKVEEKLTADKIAAILAKVDARPAYSWHQDKPHTLFVEYANGTTARLDFPIERKVETDMLTEVKTKGLLRRWAFDGVVRKAASAL